MKQPLVSIILPVYNAQSHLARCLSSICAQTYQNLEIIVLNDGSKDQSLPVCEEFRKKDSRIILVDKANSGVSDTRNLGLKLATGEYIQFVDSDDYIDPDYTGHRALQNGHPGRCFQTRTGIGKAGGRAGRDDRGPAPGSAGIWLPARGRV